MTFNRTTSRTFETGRLFRQRLQEQPWPADPRTGQTPTVTFDVEAQPDANAQIIQIMASIGEDSAITWRAMPGLRTEQFDVVTRISVYYVDPDQDGNLETAMLDRLEALSDVLQRAFFDDQTAVVANMLRPLGMDEAIDDSAVQQVGWAMYRQTDGLRGDAVITYGPRFRI